MQIDSGVSVPSTPASAVPYSDAESLPGLLIPARRPTRSRHSSLNTSPASTSLIAYRVQSRPAAVPVSITSLMNGG
jgi:hypothetical protein